LTIESKTALDGRQDRRGMPGLL